MLLDVEAVERFESVVLQKMVMVEIAVGYLFSYTKAARAVWFALVAKIRGKTQVKYNPRILMSYLP